MSQFLTGYQGLMNPNQSLVIASGQTDSGVLSCGGLALVGLILPATFTGATISFLVSNARAGTYDLLYDTANALISFSVTQGRAYAVDPKYFQGVAFLKIRSASTEGADRTIICSLKGF